MIIKKIVVAAVDINIAICFEAISSGNLAMKEIFLRIYLVDAKL